MLSFKRKVKIKKIKNHRELWEFHDGFFVLCKLTHKVVKFVKKFSTLTGEQSYTIISNIIRT